MKAMIVVIDTTSYLTLLEYHTLANKYVARERQADVAQSERYKMIQDDTG